MPSSVFPPSQPAGWQANLLEAIRQRDSQRASSLAQRCVHRYGMEALEQLLERVSVDSGPDQESRAWLLHQLHEKFTEPNPGTREGAEGDTRVGCPDSERESTDEPDPLPESVASFTPALGSTLALEAMGNPSPLPERPMGEEKPGEEVLPPSSNLFPADTAAASVPASAILDQAFAPLEIAFPPLPLLDRPVEPQEALPTTASAEAHAVKEDPPPMEAIDDRLPFDSNDLGQEIFPASFDRESPPFLAPFETDTMAAPVPRFQLDPSQEQESSTPSNRLKSEPVPEPSNTPSPSLEAWRAWLPGAFRTRQRP